MSGGANPSPRLPRLTRIKLFIYAALRCLIFRSDGSINRTIYHLVDIKSPSPATRQITPDTLVSTLDVRIDPSRNLWFRLFIPTTRPTTLPSAQTRIPFILHFHGGGFSTLGPDSAICDRRCSYLAAKIPAVIASVNYRLAPEHRCPSQYEDALDSLKFIDSNALPAVEADLRRCFVVGDSAGGNIAHHLMAAACGMKLERVRIVGLVLVQPFFGGEKRTDSEVRRRRCPVLDVGVTDGMWRSFLPEGADRENPAANVLNSRKVGDFPKTLVIVGGLDPVSDWQRRYVEWMKGECGCKDVELIEYPTAFHSFYTFPELPEFRMFVEDFTKFVLTRHN